LPYKIVCQNTLGNGGIDGGAGSTSGTLCADSRALCEGPGAITDGSEARSPVLITSPGTSGERAFGGGPNSSGQFSSNPRRFPESGKVTRSVGKDAGTSYTVRECSGAKATWHHHARKASSLSVKVRGPADQRAQPLALCEPALPSGCPIGVVTLRGPNGEKIGELRLGGGGKGIQVVAFGLHPEGMEYVFDLPIPPLVISLADLYELAGGTLEEQLSSQPAPEPELIELSEEILGSIQGFFVQCSAAIEKTGAGGHNTLFAITGELLDNFTLTDEQAVACLARYYNPRCKPAWSEKELLHKVKEARRKGHGKLEQTQAPELVGEKHQNTSKQEASFEGYAGFVTEEIPKCEFYNPFPINELPEPCRGMASAITSSLRVPLELTGPTMLGVVSSAIGKGLLLKSGDDLSVYGNLYLLGIGISGEGKSLTDRLATAPIRAIETQNRARWCEIDEPQLQAELRILEKEISKLEGQIVGRKNVVVDRAAIKKELTKKLLARALVKDRLYGPRMITEDTTQEALGLLLAHNGETLFSLSSDAGKAIHNLLGRYTKAEMSDDSLYVKAYSGDPHIVDRATRPSIALDNPVLSMFWWTQPSRASMLFSNADLREGVFWCGSWPGMPGRSQPSEIELRVQFRRMFGTLIPSLSPIWSTITMTFLRQR
jgi:hypothetical protein